MTMFLLALECVLQGMQSCYLKVRYTCFIVLVTFTQLQPYFTVLISVNCAWLKCRSIIYSNAHNLLNVKARFNDLIKAA